MTAPIAATQNLSKFFGGIHAVENVSVEFSKGVLYGLIGPNGAGKSTLVNLMSGETSADSGRVSLKGNDVTNEPAHRRAHLGLGRTFQTMRLPGSMTVWETVMSGAVVAENASVGGFMVFSRRASKQYTRAQERVSEVLEILQIDNLSDAPVRELKYADQRRLEIGRALSLEPAILLLDEPTAGMNAELLPNMTMTLRRLVDRGITVVIIEHNVPFIRSTVDSLYAMDSGQIIASGDPDAVMRDEAAVTSYLGEHRDE